MFGFISVALFSAVAYAALQPHPAPWPQLLILFLSAAFTAAICAADVIESFKASGSGIEARTRAVVAEAKGAIAEVRELAAAVGAFIVGEAAGSQFMGTLSAKTRDAQLEELVSVLRRVGVDRKGITRVRAAAVPWDRLRYENRILKGLPESSDPAVQERWNNLDPWPEIENRPSPEELEELVREFGTMTQEREELLKDLRYLLKHQKHRRPAVWAERDSW